MARAFVLWTRRPRPARMHPWIGSKTSTRSNTHGLLPEWWGAKSATEAASLAKPHVDAVARLSGSGPKRILELGAGSGFTAAALASLGHDVIAVELVDACVQSIRRLAEEVEGGCLDVVPGDFYTIEVRGSFDVVVYFDGFGIGSDDDQRRLLRRVHAWLSPQGCALIDVFVPSYWAKVAGTVEEFPTGSGVRYEERFDAEGCRMVERMWRDSAEDEAVSQSLRCYSPADLLLLLESTHLSITAMEPFEDESHRTRVPLSEAMLYLAKLEPDQERS